jgi:hypothetical protein
MLSIIYAESCRCSYSAECHYAESQKYGDIQHYNTKMVLSKMTQSCYDYSCRYAKMQSVIT